MNNFKVGDMVKVNVTTVGDIFIIEEFIEKTIKYAKLYCPQNDTKKIFRVNLLIPLSSELEKFYNKEVGYE